MADSITIREESDYLWKIVSALSALLCIIFFVLFWNLADPFWAGIARFIAFIFFAATVMGYLKLMNTGLKIQIKAGPDKVIILYEKNDSTVQEEEFDRKTILDVHPTTAGRNWVSRLIYPQSATFKINFSDTEHELYLLQYGGRQIYINPDEQEKILDFFDEHSIGSQSNKS